MNKTVPVFWSYWLLGLTLLLIVYGLAMTLAAPWMNDALVGPLLYHAEVLRHAFTNMAEPESIFRNVFDGLLGAVTISYAILIGYTTFGPFRRGERWAWNALGMSVVAWSIVEGYVKWSNGLGIWSMAHIGFLIAFSIPLLATYHYFHRQRDVINAEITPKNRQRNAED